MTVSMGSFIKVRNWSDYDPDDQDDIIHHNFGKVCKIIRSKGGYEVVHDASKAYRNIYETKSENKRPRLSAKVVEKMRLSKGLIRMQQKIFDRASKAASLRPVVKVNDFADKTKIHYDLDKNELRINGDVVKCNNHPNTLRAKARGRVRVQLTDDSLAAANITIITPELGDVVKVEFPGEGGSTVGVYYASKQSTCPVLGKLYSLMYENTGMDRGVNRLNNFLDSLPPRAWESDHCGGGHYAPFGYGIRNRPCGNPASYVNGTPYALSNMKEEMTPGITEVLSKVLSLFSSISMKYSPEEYKSNEVLKGINERLAYPPNQGEDETWFSNQVIVRRIGKGKRLPNKSREQSSVCLHTDNGDVSTKQPILYFPSGGVNGRGGGVADSDILVGEKETGGHCVRIQTCIPGTVCIVVLDSKSQLHGVVNGGECKEDREDSWVVRIVPFLQETVLSWMRKNPNKPPFDTFGNLLPSNSNNTISI